MSSVLALIKGQVKGYYRTDKTGRRVWVRPHSTKGRSAERAPQQKGKATVGELPKRARDLTPEQEERLIAHIATWDEKKISRAWESARSQIKMAMDKGDKGAAEDLRIKANIYGLALERKAKAKTKKPPLRKGVVARLPKKPAKDEPLSKIGRGAHRTPRKGYPEKPSAYASPKELSYPLNTKARVHAAVRYFSANKKRYSAEEQVAIWRRIIRAAGKFNIKLSNKVRARGKLEKAHVKGHYRHVGSTRVRVKPYERKDRRTKAERAKGEPPACPMCGRSSNYFGSVGPLNWHKCTVCGHLFNTRKGKA